MFTPASSRARPGFPARSCAASAATRTTAPTSLPAPTIRASSGRPCWPTSSGAWRSSRATTTPSESGADVMLLGLNTATLGLDDVFQAIAWIRGSGFEAIELSCDPGPNERGKVSAPQADENLIRHLREACSGFQLVSLHGPWMSFPGFSLLSADESLRSKSIEEVKACIDLAARLGSPQVIYHSGNPGRDATDEQALALARLSFAELDEHGGRRGVKLGLEVVDFFQPAERFEGFEAMPLSNTGITLDVGHISFPNPLHPGKPSYHPYDRIGAFIERFAPRLLSPSS
ncbi:MAG: sugar phosphate isomerase/epimerase [Planctomycetes bacterium]|nr:sugar phosphate isomerase/epimerase [Planctomycetota bacterium]